MKVQINIHRLIKGENSYADATVQWSIVLRQYIFTVKNISEANSMAKLLVKDTETYSILEL